jgi:hypothetical protein
LARAVERVKSVVAKYMHQNEGVFGVGLRMMPPACLPPLSCTR